jgi:nucleoside-diphosphate-sugar epimerase
VSAALRLDPAPAFVHASSAAVYGSRNPHRGGGRVTAGTPVRPVDCYGATKVAAEQIIAASGLRHAILRLGGIMSPGHLAGGAGYLVLARATPRDNRLHMVDARDVALAFVNALERIHAVDGSVLNIGGNDTFVSTHAEVQDDVFEALGLGRLGPGTNLPGDPADDAGWGLTDWFDTTEPERLLGFQRHDWSDTLAWLSESLGRRRAAVRAAGPVLRPLIRTTLAAQRRWERRGPYADPWSLITAKFGDAALAEPRHP